MMNYSIAKSEDNKNISLTVAGESGNEVTLTLPVQGWKEIAEKIIQSAMWQDESLFKSCKLAESLRANQ